MRASPTPEREQTTIRAGTAVSMPWKKHWKRSAKTRERSGSMATQTASSGTTVQVRRTFSAPRQKVFRAWTELEALNHWMCRDVESHQVRYLKLDVRPNGGYEI